MPLFRRAGRPCARPARSALTLALAITALAVPAAASAAPTASYSMTASPTQGQPTNFKSTGTCDRTPCTYAWTDPGDGQSFGTAASMTFTYNGTGSRTVKLAVRNTRGQTSSVTRSFTVKAASSTPPPPPADGDGDGTPDSSDQCPTQAGPASNHGCPTPTPPPPPPPPPSTNNCMPHPTACGYPDVGTTGVTAGTALTSVSGTVTLSTPGQVYENKIVTGSITVTAANVTIRNVRLIVTDPSYGIRVTPGGDWGRSDANLKLDHVEINLNGHPNIKGIAFSGYTAKNVFFHNGADCAHFHDNIDIEDSLCVDGPDTNNDGWPDNSSFCNGPDHFDGFQSDGGNNILIRHNTMRNPCSQTSNILLSSNTLPISNATLDNNLLAGGGFSLYCAGDTDGSRVTNIAATNNRFAKTYYAQGGYWGPTGFCELADTFSGNVWDDTGSPVSSHTN